MKLLTFGCPHCKTEAHMHMQFRQWFAHAFATAGAAPIIPEWIRCDWCRRKITAKAAGFELTQIPVERCLDRAAQAG